MNHNLNDHEKKLLREIVGAIRAKNLKEEFIVAWGPDGARVAFKENEGWLPFPAITKASLSTLTKDEYVRARNDAGGFGDGVNYVSVSKKGYDAVDSNFKEKKKADMERIRIYLMIAGLVATVIAFLYTLTRD